MTGYSAPTALCLAVLTFASAAMADVAPDALWRHWQQTAAMPSSGGTAALTLEIPIDDGTLTLTAPGLRLAPDGMGGTIVTLAPGQSVTLRSQTAEGSGLARFVLGGEGLQLTASGDLPAPDYAVQSDALSVTLTEMRQDGEALPLPEMALGLSGLAARLSGPDGADLRDLTATVETLTTTFAFDDLASGDSIDATTALFDIDLAAQFGADGPEAARWTGALALTSGPSRGTTRQSGPEIGSIETDIGTDSAQLELAVTPATVAYAAESLGTALTVRSDRLPVGEVQLDIGRSGFALTAPRPEDLDRPQGGTARVELHLADVTAGEPLWSLFDPGRALPRTAAHLDLVAEADLTPVDAATRQAFTAGDAGGLPPLLPEALRIRDFSLRFAEAEIEADGDFAAGTLTGTTLPDVTRPVGALDLTVTGGLTLLRRLRDGGLVTQEMALGAQMMIGMLSTPGEGDTLTSTIRTEADGGLVVNGTRLR